MHATQAPCAEVAEVVRGGHRIACDLGAAPLQGRLEELARRGRLELDAAPSPIDEPPAPETLGLTSREQEVLAHLAQDRTNRQIADALYISPKTASVHVSNILSKLGVANRGEAAALARRSGVSPD